MQISIISLHSGKYAIRYLIRACLSCRINCYFTSITINSIPAVGGIMTLNHDICENEFSVFGGSYSSSVSGCFIVGDDTVSDMNSGTFCIYAAPLPVDASLFIFDGTVVDVYWAASPALYNDSWSSTSSSEFYCRVS